jgi:peptidyl-prolyl cis-trans isomerase A (cyclophilin A)
MCKSLALCTEKAGTCVIGSADDCKRSELCTQQKKCTFKDGACKGNELPIGLINPLLTGDQAPEKFRAKFTTTKGDFTVEVIRSWAPLGADRFYNLVKLGFYKDVAFFRVVEGFVAQFGIHGNPEITAAWNENRIRDDPRKQSNARGTIALAMDGPNSRSTQVVISLKDNRERLDKVGVPPIGKVVDGMKVVDALTSEYGDKPPNGKGPDPAELIINGNSLLKKGFPKLDYITAVTLL